MSKGLKRLVIASVVFSILAPLLIIGLLFIADSHIKSPSLDNARTSAAPDLTQIASLVDKERVSASATPLIRDSSLDMTAKIKCQDMVNQHYIGHRNPSGQYYYDILKANNVYYQSSGENLSESSDGASKIVDGWISSPDHKANIDNPLFTHVGYASCYYGEYDGIKDAYIVVQHFTQPSSTVTSASTPDSTGRSTTSSPKLTLPDLTTPTIDIPQMHGSHSTIEPLSYCEKVQVPDSSYSTNVCHGTPPPTTCKPVIIEGQNSGLYTC